MGKMGAKALLFVKVMLLILPLFYHASLAQVCDSNAGGAECQSEYCSGIYESTDAYYGAAAGGSNSESQSSSSLETVPAPKLGDTLTPNVYEQLRSLGDGWNQPGGNGRVETAESGVSYDNVISAAKSFPSFGTTGNSTSQRRDVAAFFAHACHGIHTTSEADSVSPDCDLSCTEYPCAPGKAYHSRGPFKLSGNCLYGAAGKAIGQDLLNNPDLVDDDPLISAQTALWFWTNAQGSNPSCHDAIDGTWIPSQNDIWAGRFPGFGLTIDILNGKTECGLNARLNKNPSGRAAALDRIVSYAQYAAVLGVDPGSHVDCGDIETVDSSWDQCGTD